MISTSSLKKQGGFILQVGIVLAMFALSIIMSVFLRIQSESLNMQRDNLQGQRISTFIHAIKNATTQAGSLAQWNVAGQPFEDGAVHIGTLWLKDVPCGGPQPDEFMFCDFENAPMIGDDMQYRSEISNDGTTLNIAVEVSDSTRSRGFDFNGENGVTRSCGIATVAGGGLSNTAFDGSLANVDCDTDTGVITFDIAWNSATSDDLSIRGLNSPLTAIPWGGQNLDDMDQLEVSTIVDRDDPVFTLDLDGTSELNVVNANEVNATDGTIDTFTSTDATITTLDGTDLNYTNVIAGTANITTAINQFDAAQFNNFAGGLAVGTGANISTIENGSIYVPGSIVDANDSSMFLDPGGVSRVLDMRLTARGGVSLSNLTPNYVHKGSTTIYGQGVLNKVDCGDGAGTTANRLVVNWEDDKTSIADAGSIVSNYAYNRVRVQTNATSYLVQLLTYDFTSRDWSVMAENRALLTIYCYYP